MATMMKGEEEGTHTLRHCPIAKLGTHEWLMKLQQMSEKGMLVPQDKSDGHSSKTDTEAVQRAPKLIYNIGLQLYSPLAAEALKRSHHPSHKKGVCRDSFNGRFPSFSSVSFDLVNSAPTSQRPVMRLVQISYYIVWGGVGWGLMTWSLVFVGHLYLNCICST